MDSRCWRLVHRDGSIRLWDCRVSPKDACVCTVKDAHDKDVNVISWNRTDPLLVSGGDDGLIKIWDLKMIQVYILQHFFKALVCDQIVYKFGVFPVFLYF